MQQYCWVAQLVVGLACIYFVQIQLRQKIYSELLYLKTSPRPKNY
jgi:hypothetical protein